MSAGAREQIRSWTNDEELPHAAARDESPALTNETSTGPAPTSDASPQLEVLWPEMHAQVLGPPQKSYFEELLRSPFKVIYASVLVIIVAVLGHTYRKATEVRYTYTIPSSESNLSEAATDGDVFAKKSEMQGAPARATPQSSSTAKANAARPPAREASAADVALPKPSLPRGALFVQVGAFVQQANASKLAESLREENFPALILSSKNGALYRVHIGPYPDEESAQIAQTELRKMGFKPLILSGIK
jgi:cell division septation protein DedD